MGRGGEEQEQPPTNLVPVTLLCGFLGAGKTTLLKHILETKHEEKDFKCAVIVNDMAELNIDEKLIDNTSLIQSDEAMVGMQNGCICCTLQNDLVEQIIQLTQSEQKFNYILIEASGVSEPHEIAPLFEVEKHDHGDEEAGHNHDHDKLQLGQVARLDTCVTLIDSAEFHNNLGSMKTYDQCDVVGTIAELMMDQVEFANVIVLNKGDLVNEEQKHDLEEKIALLNPQAKIIKSVQSKINVKDILNTSLYKDKDEFWVTSTKTAEYAEKERKRLEALGERVPEACTARFDIKSFVYRARKPFHPGRLSDKFLKPYFMDPIGDLNEEEDEDLTEEEKKKIEVEKQIKTQKDQDEAYAKQKKRHEVMGEVLRSKGFLWLATSHDVIGGWQQAGSVLRIVAEQPWMCLRPELWEGLEGSEALVRQDMTAPSGEEYQYQDRRQEIVFIGHRMQRAAIQELLDSCLLTDEEMELGPEKWKETMEQFGVIKLELEECEEGEDEEDDEEDSEDENVIKSDCPSKTEECIKACELLNEKRGVKRSSEFNERRGGKKAVQ